TIELQAFSTNEGVDYAHAFTAGVGTSGGGHADIIGGSIKASGSKRTVGIQANNGGSIRAHSGARIETHNHFGHAVNVYSDPAVQGDSEAEHDQTSIDLDDVHITTHGDHYSVGIQVAHKGSTLSANDVRIETEGVNSFGVEVFDGASLTYTGGSIRTTGDGAAGVRTYGGALGSGVAAVTN